MIGADHNQIELVRKRVLHHHARARHDVAFAAAA
jgi:hypothetical protein